MQHDPLKAINHAITYVDWFLQRQIEMDHAAIEHMREQQQVAHVWGFTVLACPTDRIVESTIEEVQDEQ